MEVLKGRSAGRCFFDFHLHECTTIVHRCVQRSEGSFGSLERETGTMPRANRLRIREAVPVARKTTERDVAVIVSKIVECWDERWSHGYAGSRDPVAFATWIAGQSGEWFEKLGTAVVKRREALQRQRLAVVKKMRAELIGWIRPLKKGGRCRRASRR